MNEAEMVSPYRGGWNVSMVNNKVSFKLVRQEPKNMTAGEWISYGNNAGQVAIQSITQPILSVNDMIAGDISFNMIANGASTVFLAPGECNNQNGIFQIPIDQAVTLGVSTVDEDGNNREHKIGLIV